MFIMSLNNIGRFGIFWGVFYNLVKYNPFCPGLKGLTYVPSFKMQSQHDLEIVRLFNQPV